MDRRSSVERVLPCALAFLVSFCVMSVELVASRLMARQVGGTLYVWTAVIGVILGGITLGNWAGGAIADRFEARRALASLLVLAGIAAAVIPLLNAEMQFWSRWDLPDTTRSWPYRISVHVTATFLGPATLLGTMGPVIAKMALDRGLERGRTLGNVYSWGALGSIVGTFASGFWLIALLGSEGVVFAVGGFLTLLGICVALRPALAALAVGWPLVAACALVLNAPETGRSQSWTWAAGEIRLQERVPPVTIYERESQYSYIRVLESPETGTRKLFLDNLIHAIYVPSDPHRLEYDYERIYAAVTERFSSGSTTPRALFLGGGGYVFPRYFRNRWPGSRVKVSEIDPAVTQANFDAFGLELTEVHIMEGKGGAGEEEHPFEIYHLDARNHVEDMIQARRRRETVEPFDFVYGDAFSDFFIPYHLVTREFTQKIKELLRPETGMYLINVIEIFDSGLFLGALHATLESVFPHVYILAGNEGGPDQDPSIRSTFILVASLRPLDLGELGKREEARTLVGTPLRAEQVADLRRRSKSVILTDDFSPVENLLEPVVRKRGMLLEAKAEAKPETKFEAESKSVEESPEQTGEGGTANHDANR